MTETNLRSLAEDEAEARSAAARHRAPPDHHRRPAKRSCAQSSSAWGSSSFVFLPILTLQGIEGKMFRPMAWTFIFAMLGALAVAITFSPILSYYFLPRDLSRHEGPRSRALQRAYRGGAGNRPSPAGLALRALDRSARIDRPHRDPAGWGVRARDSPKARLSSTRFASPGFRSTRPRPTTARSSACCWMNFRTRSVTSGAVSAPPRSPPIPWESS